MATSVSVSLGAPSGRPTSIDKPMSGPMKIGFFGLIVGALVYAFMSIVLDTQGVGENLELGVFAFLGLALVIALGFEFVNGFHDTANAVATVIYTNSLPAPVAVIWSGFLNFLGVLFSSGAVAYSIITLLPVELILNVGSSAGFAMIFALLVAAVLWNLATWYAGLPNSSSHTLIGSILGVGIANQIISAGSKNGTAGVDWAQVQKVLSALLFSPLMGFVGALILILVMRAFLRNRTLYSTPPKDSPPPFGIRALLVFTCSAVSFAHGGNDGQKGMGLIMLILIGCAPTAYAINRTMPASDTAIFVQNAHQAAQAFNPSPVAAVPSVDAARVVLRSALQQRKVDGPAVDASLAVLSNDLATNVEHYGALAHVPAAATRNLRNDMYLVLDTSRLITKGKDAEARLGGAANLKTVKDYEARLEQGTRYIPVWVKVAVAFALGLGTMVGWKRIVVTVGERIGKDHFSYGMGSSAELVAASTILLAEQYGLPVSTTHILTSGVAGAAVGQGSGLQFATIRNMVFAWVLTLPMAMVLAGGLYWLLLQIFV